MTGVFTKSFAGLMLAIAATGALLNIANKGTLGSQAQRLSRFITSGYGAGPF